ncbi:MAG: sensor histidine kinase [Kiritimatiellia bacterium]
MATFLFNPNATEAKDRLPSNEGLGSAILVYNVRWFIRVRWAVVVVLLLSGVVSLLIPSLVTMVGLVTPCAWIWLMAGVVALTNIFFWLLARPLTEKSPDHSVTGNIWLQIVVDLAIITFLVHFVGSTSSFIPFTYLFHIVLACIFFAPAQSLLVTLIAGSFYLLCVSLEIIDWWTRKGIALPQARHLHNPNLALLLAISAVFVWLVVWYLVSTLSKIVKDRDRLLESANRRLLAADEEKNRIMLRTAHDLKAPFSGIECNIQRLKMQHWDVLTPPVKELVARIEVRGQTLSRRIRDILMLGDLRTRGQTAAATTTVDLTRVLQTVVEDLDSPAQDRQVQVQCHTLPLTMQGCEHHYFILFSNLLSNAISYSHPGDSVQISMCTRNKQIVVSIRDQGIGISEAALPHIFEEYFRSQEAAQYNPASTGLGLAIVQEVAQKEGLQLSVTSAPGQGTTFEVIIPVRQGK